MSTPLAELSLEELSKKTLDNDDEEPSQAYMDALQKFRHRNPSDLNFIVELGKIGKSVGGNGFGTATCMEDYCWTDVMLDADPELPDGGKKDGIGSLFNYQEHCKDSEHVKGRSQRLEKEANAAPVSAPKIFEAMEKHHQVPSQPSSSTPARGKENAGIPRTASSSSPHSFGALHTLPNNVQVKLEHDRKGKGTDLKPTLSQLAAASGSSRGTFDAPFVISDGESDDEVLALSESQIPDEFKRKSNKDAPYILDDDDEPAPPRSSAPLAEKFRSSSNQAPRSAPRPSWAVAPAHSEARHSPSGHSGVASTSTPSAISRTVSQPDLGTIIQDTVRTPSASPAQLFTGDLYSVLDKSASHSMATWETTFLDSEPFKAAASLRQALAASITSRRVACNLTLGSKGKIQYTRPPHYLLAHFPTYHMKLATWERSIRRHLGKKGVTHNAGSSSALAKTPSVDNLTMPGHLPFDPYVGLAPVAGPSNAAAQEGDIFARHMEYGYEMDRPQTSEGLNQLFQTAFEDCAEDIKVEEALKGLGLNSLEDLLPGLECRLMPHQVIGVHWMVKQERKRGSAGGILGDEMGLGKTVQAIGTMVKNPSTLPRVKTTLIVVPTALLEQWKSEIESKSNLTAMIYHGGKRTKSLNVLKNAEVVITSYGTVTGERPQNVDDAKQKKKKKKRKQPRDTGYDSFVSDDEREFERPRKTGLLFQMEWFRVILDEAAFIRNKNTMASRAVVELKSRINWCLTGTLIYNKLDDIYPYLRFIGAIGWDDFSEKVSRPAARKPRLASKRAQALLKPVMLRRTKDSELDGKKILQLPPKTVEVVQLDFSPEERAVYASVEQRARVRVNKYLRAGTVLKHYHVILVMLMRLRQLCCHPWLLRAKGNQISPDGMDLTVTDDDIFGDLDGAKVDDESEYGRAVALQGQAWVDKVTETLKKRQEAMSDDDLPPATQARAADDENDYNCPVCFEPYTDEVVTACQHSFCAQCIEDVLNRPENDHRATEDQMNRRACLCPLCRDEITKQRMFRAAAFYKPNDGDEDDEEIDVKPGSSSGKRSSDAADLPSKKVKSEEGKGRGTAMDIHDDELDEGDLDERGIEQVVPSTKMKEAGDVLDAIFDDDPAQKTLIFCTFVEMLDLMAVFLERRRIPYLTYTGKLKQQDRTDTIARFNDVKTLRSPRVMLISMKCGGVGLNLTAANNVICLDMAWSPAAELQAIDRAHRIGQTRAVSVKRMVITNSVDERILALQEKKQALADGALGEGSGGKLGRLTAQELVRLFGREEDDH